MIALLLKASLIIAILLGFYKGFLERESFFSTNRSYLLACLVMTFTLPFITLPQMINEQGIISMLIEKHIDKPAPVAAIAAAETEIPNLKKAERIKEQSENTAAAAPKVKTEIIDQSKAIPATEETAPSKSELTSVASKEQKGLRYWILMIYYFGVGVFFLNFLFQIGNVLLKIIRSTDKIQDEDNTIINSTAMTEPCSFFRYIFINPESYDYDTYEQILAHEKIHVRKKHSFDLLLSEIAVIFLWFNPLMWLFRKEVEKNIEYQTDDILIHGEAVEKESYQMNLLKVAAYSMPLTITTNYNQSLIKQRIMKISAKKSNPQSLWKYAFIAPLVFTLLLFINKPNIAIANELTDASISLNENPTDKTEETTTAKLDIATFLENYSKLSDSEKKELLRLLKGTSEPEVTVENEPSDKPEQAQITSENQLTTEQFTNLSEPSKDQNLSALNVISDLDKDEKKEVLNILENLEELKSSDSFEQFSEDEKADLTKVLSNDSDGLADFEFQIDYSDFEDLQGIGLKFVFEDISLEQRIRTMETISYFEKTLTAEQKRATFDIFTAYGDLEMEETLAILQGKKGIKDFDLNNISTNNLKEDLPFDDDCKALLLAVRKENIADVRKMLATVDPNCFVNDPGNEKFIEGNTTWNILRAQTPLVAAGRVGNVDIAKLLINEGADVNFHGKSNETPLMAAAKYGDLEFVKYLVSKGAKTNTLVKHWGSARSIAAREGHLNVVKYLKSSKKDIDSRVPHVGTSLIEAATNGHLDIVEYLVAEGANVNIDEAHVGTPLIVASKNGHLETVQYLISKDAMVNDKVAHVGTPLICAAKNGHLETVKYLISKGANIDKSVAHVGTPLIVATKNGHSEIVNYLSSNGADMNKDVAHVGTPLLVAAKHGELDVVKNLIANGADVNEGVAHVGTPLIVASKKGQVEVVKYLISKGADVDKGVAHVGTPLLIAAKSGDIEIVELLVSKGANLNEGVAHVGTPLIVAAKHGQAKMVEFLISKGADVDKGVAHVGTPLLVAASDGEVDVVQQLIAGGADIDKGVAHVGTPLIVAAQDGQIEVVKLLIKNGANLDKAVAHVGTPLIGAAQDGQLKVVKYLIEKGANLDKEVAHVGTPLIGAAQDGQFEVVKLLVSNGANINKWVQHVGSPLSEALEHRETHIAEYLRAQGAEQ